MVTEKLILILSLELCQQWQLTNGSNRDKIGHLLLEEVQMQEWVNLDLDG